MYPRSFNTHPTTNKMTPFILYSILLIKYITLNCHCSEIINKDSGNNRNRVASYINNYFCKNKVCVQKCCPPNKYVFGLRTCGELKFPNVSLDFSDMEVYNEERTKVVSTVDRTLALIPSKFDNLTILKRPLRINLVPGINLYLTEGDILENPFIVDTYYVKGIHCPNYKVVAGFRLSVDESVKHGNLYKEIPNFYDRWTRWDPMNFCIDYYINKKLPHHKPIPQIWIPYEESSDEIKYKPYQIYAGLVSCVFLLLVFAVYIILPDLRNLGGKIVMAYVFSLFWSYVFLYINQNYVWSNCTPLALVTYFFFMTSFCWMNIMSFDIWWTFRSYAKTRVIHRRGELYKFLMYCFYACGLPLLMTTGLGVVDSLNLKHLPWIVTPSIGRGECFLEGGSKFLYLYIPMTILILMNWLFFSMTAFNVWRLCRGTKVLNLADSSSSTAQHKQWRRFMVYLKLSVVMGLSWVFEMLSYLFPGAIWNITDAYNLFIGLAIFIIFVCKKKIFRKLVKRFKTSRRNYDWRRSTQNTENVTSTFIVKEPQRDVCINPQGPEFEIKIKNYE